MACEAYFENGPRMRGPEVLASASVLEVGGLESRAGSRVLGNSVITARRCFARRSRGVISRAGVSACTRLYHQWQQYLIQGRRSLRVCVSACAESRLEPRYVMRTAMSAPSSIAAGTRKSTLIVAVVFAVAGKMSLSTLRCPVRRRGSEQFRGIWRDVLVGGWRFTICWCAGLLDPTGDGVGRV